MMWSNSGMHRSSMGYFSWSCWALVFDSLSYLFHEFFPFTFFWSPASVNIFTLPKTAFKPLLRDEMFTLANWLGVLPPGFVKEHVVSVAFLSPHICALPFMIQMWSCSFWDTVLVKTYFPIPKLQTEHLTVDWAKLEVLPSEPMIIFLETYWPLIAFSNVAKRFFQSIIFHLKCNMTNIYSSSTLKLPYIFGLFLRLELTFHGYCTPVFHNYC